MLPLDDLVPQDARHRIVSGQLVEQSLDGKGRVFLTKLAPSQAIAPALPVIEDQHILTVDVLLDGGQQVCRREVVRVYPDDVRPRRRPQARVASGRNAPVRLMDDPHVLRKACGIRVADRPAAIRRAVVHQNDLRTIVHLRKQSVQTFRQIGRDVVHRKNNRKQKLVHFLTHRFFIRLSSFHKRSYHLGPS